MNDLLAGSLRACGRPWQVASITLLSVYVFHLYGHGNGRNVSLIHVNKQEQGVIHGRSLVMVTSFQLSECSSHLYSGLCDKTSSSLHIRYYIVMRFCG